MAVGQVPEFEGKLKAQLDAGASSSKSKISVEGIVACHLPSAKQGKAKRGEGMLSCIRPCRSEAPARLTDSSEVAQAGVTSSARAVLALLHFSGSRHWRNVRNSEFGNKPGILNRDRGISRLLESTLFTKLDRRSRLLTIHKTLQVLQFRVSVRHSDFFGLHGGHWGTLSFSNSEGLGLLVVTSVG